MNQVRKDVRLSRFPQVGTDIRVLSQNGLKTYTHGRISSDDGSLIIDVIKKPRGQREFPTITKTVVLDLDELVKISFKDIDGNRISLTGDSNYWLNGIPRSGKSSVQVLCPDKDRTVDISCGWVEYTRNKVIVREIIRVTEFGSEIDTHERFLSEVVLVLVSDDEESKVCVRTTETK